MTPYSLGSSVGAAQPQLLGWCRKSYSIIFGGGSKPVAVVLDCSKAFDLAKFDILFDRLLSDRKMPAIVVRVLAYSYQEQLAWVRCGRGCTSTTFKISNGTRQASVESPAFWSVYLDPLFSLLRRDGVGCHV